MTKKRVALGVFLIGSIVLTLFASYRLINPEYACIVSGDNRQYKDGGEIEKRNQENIQFNLHRSYLTGVFSFSDPKIFYGHNNEGITLNKSISNPVDTYYTYDVTNKNSQERIATSLSINETSGDVRLFHHRWIPPNGWENSDLYAYSGYCLPIKKYFLF